MTSRMSLLIAVMLLGAPWIASDLAGAVSEKVARTVGRGRPSPWVVQITPRSGQSRTATLDGVGCSQAICSRVSVRTRAVGDPDMGQLRFDTIAAIKVVGNGEATLELNDGTSRRVVVAPENRVLYFLDADGGSRRVDLGELVALEFLRREGR